MRWLKHLINGSRKLALVVSLCPYKSLRDVANIKQMMRPRKMIGRNDDAKMHCLELFGRSCQDVKDVA